MRTPVPLALLCGLAFCTGCSREQWPVARELCGKVQIIDRQEPIILKDTDLVLYKSNSENLECCSKAQRIADIRIDSFGNFKSDGVDAGRYFLVVKNSPQIVFPEYLEESYDGGRCSLNTIYSFDRSTGKTERTATIRVYSTN